MFKIGYNMDFSMRASIPALCVLCVFVIRFLTEEHSGARPKGFSRAAGRTADDRCGHAA